MVSGIARLVHPFPSFLNAALVLGIALVAGGSPLVAGVLALSMLGLQFCIGAVNELFDERLDALSKPWKPIPAGVVTRGIARAVAFASGGAGLALAGLGLGPDAILLGIAAAMLSAGLVYDAWLKPTAFGWVCFAIAFPILPIFAWYGATGAMLPPRAELLLPVAVLAGPMLHIANGLVDLQSDAAAGVRTLPVALGRRLSLAVLAVLTVTVHGLAVATSQGDGLSGVATYGVLFVAGYGVACSATLGVRARQTGWTLQAVALAAQGVLWLMSVAR